MDRSTLDLPAVMTPAPHSVMSTLAPITTPPLPPRCELDHPNIDSKKTRQVFAQPFASVTHHRSRLSWATELAKVSRALDNQNTRGGCNRIPIARYPTVARYIAAPMIARYSVARIVARGMSLNAREWPLALGIAETFPHTVWTRETEVWSK